MTRYVLIVLICYLVVPTTCWSQSRDDSWTTLKQQMSVSASISIRNVPLDEALDALRARYGVAILVDTVALDDLGIEAGELISVELNQVPIAVLLDVMLSQLELTWTFRHHTIYITSEDVAHSYIVTRVYPIPDLLLEGEYGDDYDTVIDTIISTLASDTWVENGGPAAEIRPFPAASALVISQSPRIHLQIEQLLADLRRVRSAQGLTVYQGVSSNTRQSTRAPRVRRPKTYIQPTGQWRMPQSYGDSP
ncbi:MAG: hypothetical protein ACR2NU_03725 [Aeoliella sp.]